MADVVVRNNTEKHRYEAVVDGEVAGFADYGIGGDAIVFLHTEVEDRFEGQGIGSALVRGSLDQVRAEGAHDVVPLCPFYRGWIEKHPDYQDLVHAR